MTYCVDQISEDESQDNTKAANNVSSSTTDSINLTCPTQHDADDHVAQFYVAMFDFAYVDTPLLVVVWVLFTAAAKIGQKTS